MHICVCAQFMCVSLFCVNIMHVYVWPLFSEEHKELQRLHSCKNEEHQGVILKLQSQLRNAYTELDQARSTLSTLEGADGHGQMSCTIKN